MGKTTASIDLNNRDLNNRDRQTGHSIAPHFGSISAAIKDFIVRLKADGRSPLTIVCYQGELQRLVSIVQARRLVDVDEALICSALNELSGCDTGRRALRMQTTMNKIKSAYKAFFNWCFISGRIVQDPARGLKMARATVSANPYISSVEVNRLHDCIRSTPTMTATQDEALFAVYAFTGARRSEVLSLRISDFDAAGSALHSRTVKGGGSRRQNILARLAAILSRYLRSPKMKRLSDDNFMFAAANGTPLSPRVVQDRFTKWKRRARISAF